MGAPGLLISDNVHRCKDAIQRGINNADFKSAKRILNEYGKKLLDKEVYENFSQRITLAEDAYVGFKSVPQRVKFNFSRILQKLLLRK